MGNKQNQKRKSVSWRKKRGKHVSDILKMRRLQQDVDDGGDKENIPENTMQMSSEQQVSINQSGQSDLLTLENVNLLFESEPSVCPTVNKTPQNESNDDDNVNWFEISQNKSERSNIFKVEGRRIVDFEYFYKNLQRICGHNKAFGCTLNNVHIISEKRKGLLSKFSLKCNMCNEIFYLDSEPDSNLDLNRAVTSGIITSGIGYSQFNELCASMDCPTFTQKLYDKVQTQIYNEWQYTAVNVMEKAGIRERDAAIAEGRVDKNGIAYIDVIADGVWSKRSFNTNYSALSGAAAIIGKRFGEVLFIGVKNKYCCICARADNKGIAPGDHVCFKNYSGPSTGMESDLLLEGFKQSVSTHMLIYERMVADGDSSTYKKILEGRPYPNCTVEKIECKNHILRNMCKKLKSLTTETKYPASLRKKITTQRILAIRKVICSSITEHRSKHADINTQINDLFRDITNAHNHAFGNHEDCQSYYCNSKKNSEDVTLIFKTCALWHRIKFIVNTVASKARSLIHDSDSNKVESFNSIIAKFVGGKRINFSLRRGYESRCNAAVVSFNTKCPLSTLHRSITGKSPRAAVKKLEERRFKQRKSASKYIGKRKKLFLISQAKNGDKNYGENCQRPDMSASEYQKIKDDFLKNLPSSEEEIKQIERATILQRDSSTWLELRRKLLTASNFSKVINRRPATSVKNIIKNIIYPKNLSYVPSLKHGIENETVALEQLKSQLNNKIEPCGLFIDKKLPFLGATPDGVIGDDTLVEIKCPITAFKTSIEDAIKTRKINFWKSSKDGLIINKRHTWYIQVQGQLHITGRQKCILGVWSGCERDIKIQTIERDDLFWARNMEGKLKEFYMEYMLPELCDARHTRNMPIRDSM